MVLALGGGLAALSAPVIAIAATPDTAASPGPAPSSAPRAESFSPYLPQLTCDPQPKPGAEALRALLKDTYGNRAIYIARACAAGGRSEHKEGRALDWMLDARDPADIAVADRFLSWLLASGADGISAYNARRLGVMYVIWNRHVWNAYRAVDGWQPYTGASPHTDHIHVSLAWNGAMRQTSFWTGRVAPVDYGPCARYLGLPPEPYTTPRVEPTCPPARDFMTLTGSPVLRAGSTGPYVAQLQRRLRLFADGEFGGKTVTAVTSFQLVEGLSATGSTDVATWARLRAVAAAQAVTGTAPSPPAKTGRPGTPPLDTAKRATTARADASLAPFAALTLRQGARGVAVGALQKALGISADGLFGPKTAAAVRAFSTVHHLTADGVVRPSTWVALQASRATPSVNRS